MKLLETVRRSETQRMNLASATLASADLHRQINFRLSINSLQIKNIITAPRSDMIMIIKSVYFHLLSILTFNGHSLTPLPGSVIIIDFRL